MNGQYRPDGWVVPDWWDLTQAARYFGVAPWELARQPAGWLTVAAACIEAENHAAEMRAKTR